MYEHSLTCAQSSVGRTSIHKKIGGVCAVPEDAGIYSVGQLSRRRNAVRSTQKLGLHSRWHLCANEGLGVGGGSAGDIIYERWKVGGEANGANYVTT